MIKTMEFVNYLQKEIRKLEALLDECEQFKNVNPFNHKDPNDIDRDNYPNGFISLREQNTDTGYPYKG